ncbi:MAG: hypothetical protein Q4Q08_09450 [Eubacteriales bacterium]|nr:hypothetical protein [Eubacteriales bacterium]
MEKILYHVSTNSEEPLTKRFIPRIPLNPENGEDETIPRICFSDSIPNCLNAIGWHSSESGDDYFDIIVWEHAFSLEDPHLVSWETLYEKQMVPDSGLTHEYWYTAPITLTGCLYRVYDVDNTYYTRHTATIIYPNYKATLLDILADYGVNIETVSFINLSTLYNEWLPLHLPLRYDEIKSIMESRMVSIAVPNQDESNYYHMLFGENCPPKSTPDYEPLDLFDWKVKKI